MGRAGARFVVWSIGGPAEACGRAAARRRGGAGETLAFHRTALVDHIGGGPGFQATPSASAIAARCTGVEPQHAPMIEAPASQMSSA